MRARANGLVIWQLRAYMLRVAVTYGESPDATTGLYWVEPLGQGSAISPRARTSKYNWPKAGAIFRTFWMPFAEVEMHAMPEHQANCIRKC